MIIRKYDDRLLFMGSEFMNGALVMPIPNKEDWNCQEEGSKLEKRDMAFYNRGVGRMIYRPNRHSSQYALFEIDYERNKVNLVSTPNDVKICTSTFSIDSHEGEMIVDFLEGVFKLIPHYFNGTPNLTKMS